MKKETIKNTCCQVFIRLKLKEKEKNLHNYEQITHLSNVKQVMLLKYKEFELRKIKNDTTPKKVYGGILLGVKQCSFK